MGSRRTGPIGILCLLLLICQAGCQFTQSTDILTAAVGPDDMTETAGFTYFSVDLPGDSTDTFYPFIDIDRVINIGFQVWLSNGSGEAGFFGLYASPWKGSMDFTDAALMANNTLPILAGPEVAAGQTLYLDWPTSMQYVINRERAYPLFETGRLTFYYYSENAGIELDSISVIVTAEITENW